MPNLILTLKFLWESLEKLGTLFDYWNYIKEATEKFAENEELVPPPSGMLGASTVQQILSVLDTSLEKIKIPKKLDLNPVAYPSFESSYPDIATAVKIRTMISEIKTVAEEGALQVSQIRKTLTKSSEMATDIVAVKKSLKQLEDDFEILFRAAAASGISDFTTVLGASYLFIHSEVRPRVTSVHQKLEKINTLMQSLMKVSKTSSNSLQANLRLFLNGEQEALNTLLYKFRDNMNQLNRKAENLTHREEKISNRYEDLEQKKAMVKKELQEINPTDSDLPSKLVLMKQELKTAIFRYKNMRYTGYCPNEASLAQCTHEAAKQAYRQDRKSASELVDGLKLKILDLEQLIHAPRDIHQRDLELIHAELDSIRAEQQHLRFEIKAVTAEKFDLENKFFELVESMRELKPLILQNRKDTHEI